MKVWESPFIPSHLTFKKFRIHSISVNQSNNQSNLSIYYNIPKFRILGCYNKKLRFFSVTKVKRREIQIDNCRKFTYCIVCIFVWEKKNKIAKYKYLVARSSSGLPEKVQKLLWERFTVYLHVQKHTQKCCFGVLK